MLETVAGGLGMQEVVLGSCSDRLIKKAPAEVRPRDVPLCKRGGSDSGVKLQLIIWKAG